LEGRTFDVVKFRNGYASNAPEMIVEYRGLKRASAARNADYVIRLGKVLQIKRWRGT
jgi:lipopolysaccharide/colanic/teichoic acid biosynthesis glycosyltransferase